MCSNTPKKGKPAWLKKRLPLGNDYQRVKNLLSDARLSTVCQAANCPNMFECFSKNTSTFMILGSECTRHCRFCNVTAGSPLPLDPDEPVRVARTAHQLGLTYVVVTSVTRDDLPDGGATHFAAVINAIKTGQAAPGDSEKTIARVEVLIPDFQGDIKALDIVVRAKPDVINHNIETVASLYETVRPEAQYQRSLDLLKNVKALDPLMPLKSGIMVGLGETTVEVARTLEDLFKHGCDIVTIGQYLQPTRAHLNVKKYYSPEEFKQLEQTAKKLGFSRVAAGPFVRSSYNAQDLFNA
ncbi:MAG: lipoyl synthase [Proteobacteria bacterium]|nr:lipoyl synthase [Desulfobacula sp.]MBU4130143.1 lipoyl synthase [Pseudomonadota bacterium]